MFGDVKVVRLKQASWLEGPTLIRPKISEEQMKQSAVLSHNFHPDLQLETLLDFVDIGDPSVVNTLYASVAKLYEKMSKNEYALNYTTEGVELDSEQFSDVVAKKFRDAFSRSLTLHQAENAHKERLTREQIE